MEERPEMVPGPMLMPGAEPFSHDGDRRGVVVVHGFTGSPASVRPLAEAFAGRGWTVRCPRLPGHGTSIADMLTTMWGQWAAEVVEALQDLIERCDRIVLAGQSMGAALVIEATLDAHSLDPRLAEALCAVVAVSPKLFPADPELVEMVRDMIAGGELVVPGGGSGICNPDAVDVSYSDNPLPQALELWKGLERLLPRLGAGTVPLLMFCGAHDDVVEPEEFEYLLANWGGPVERIDLARSGHVAVLDFESATVTSESVRFAEALAAVRRQ